MNIIGPHFRRDSKNRFFKIDFYFVSTPWWLRRLFPGCIWDLKTTEKTIYLSFDDGPHPAITPFVLNELCKFNAKATFFCIGNNVLKYPETFKQVIDEGHAIGNHTMNHISGWKNTDENYLYDIMEAGKLINSELFRPPFGRIKNSQIKLLQKLNPGLKIIMWSVLTGDWDKALSPKKCFDQVKKKIYPGSIIVFHDSEKANERMSYTLPKVLEYYSKLGYSFKKLEINS